jgi:predicted DNA-binding protein YlxM (UPF0122 family)
MRRRIVKEAPLATFHKDVGTLWRSRNDEPETEVFKFLPKWMSKEQADIDEHLDIVKSVNLALEFINTQEKNVMLMRYWSDMTLDEIGESYHLSKERIRQIEAKALRKLKHPSRNLDVFKTNIPQETKEYMPHADKKRVVFTFPPELLPPQKSKKVSQESKKCEKQTYLQDQDGIKKMFEFLYAMK